DGKIATSSGDSRWITNEACRLYVHRLRGQVDAVMVGSGTVRRDDPRLDVRIKGWSGINPKAVVIDEALDLPRSSRVFKRPRGDSIFFTTVRAPAFRRRWIEKRGHLVVVCRATGDGRVFLPQVLTELGKMGITSVLLEGGGCLFSDFFKRRLVDRLVACIAPKLIGGRGMDFLPGIEIRRMKDAIDLDGASIQQFGDNVVVEGVFKKR
ncbi:MAG: RibD family protein, partial [Pseudomonadota bacterium]